MDKQMILKLKKAFEDYAQEADGVEFWFARDLQMLWGYDKWENFLNAIEKAEIACKNSGHDVNDHFPDIRKMVEIGSGAKREIEGLKEAMKRFNLKEGLIITNDQEDMVENIKIIPAWKWLINVD